MVRLEGEKLFIERTEGDDVMLDRRYRLGTAFTLRLEAGHGRVKAWYEGEQKMDWPISRSGCYFKAGCYTQSNEARGDDPADYGEVEVYELTVK
jgi:poly(beta-D-mannuronate) lyase